MERQETTGAVFPMPTVTEDIRLLDYDEVARNLGISRRQVERFVASGELRPVVLGGRKRIRPSVLHAFILRLEDSGLATTAGAA